MDLRLRRRAKQEQCSDTGPAPLEKKSYDLEDGDIGWAADTPKDLQTGTGSHLKETPTLRPYLKRWHTEATVLPARNANQLQGHGFMWNLYLYTYWQ